MSKLTAERIVAMCLIIVAAILYTQSMGLQNRAGSFPQFAEISIALLASLMLIRTFLKNNKKRLSGNVYFEFTYKAWKPVAVMVAGIAYSFAIFKLGFYVSSVIFFFAAAYMTGLRSHKYIFLTAAILFPLIYLFFTVVMDAFLPEGILF
jgi:hypothetical protein